MVRLGQCSVLKELRVGASGAPDYTSRIVSAHPSDSSAQKCLELPVEELLRRARPLPDHDEMVIDDLTVEEGEAFLAAIES